ncbi:hypothetical protein CU103_30840 [Phyllobacterium sophorae]|uniref:Uncharacterized protein n=1 Tax=Phyllobacterium sophorae TaxID=1520277 RepID=A0A2P7AM36_9HYPH|nr:hypothetical protein CU103_30840 [Phyllobacterium sophorae]
MDKRSVENADNKKMHGATAYQTPEIQGKRVFGRPQTRTVTSIDCERQYLNGRYLNVKLLVWRDEAKWQLGAVW